MKTASKILPLLLSLTTISILPLRSFASTAAYLYYTNATCVDSNRVEGSLVYGYNDPRMKGKGFVRKEYYGPCKYFDGGYFDFMYEKSDGNYMKTGYCIQCNGLIGCTKTMYDCSDFQTLVPSTRIYTLSATMATKSNQTEDDENDVTEDSQEEAELSQDMKEQAEKFQSSVYKEISMVDVKESIMFFSILGILCGFMSMFALFSSIKGMKRLLRVRSQSKKASIVDTSSFLDGFDKEGYDNDKAGKIVSDIEEMKSKNDIQY